MTTTKIGRNTSSLMTIVQLLTLALVSSTLTTVQARQQRFQPPPPPPQQTPQNVHPGDPPPAPHQSDHELTIIAIEGQSHKPLEYPSETVEYPARGEVVRGSPVQTYTWKAFGKRDNPLLPDKDSRLSLPPSISDSQGRHHPRPPPQQTFGNQWPVARPLQPGEYNPLKDPNTFLSLQSSDLGSSNSRKSKSDSSKRNRRLHKKKLRRRRKKKRRNRKRKYNRKRNQGGKLDNGSSGVDGDSEKKHGGRKKNKPKGINPIDLLDHGPSKGNNNNAVIIATQISLLKETCITKTVQQVIKQKGCKRKVIRNRYCYGQCNSFYIPELNGRGNGPPSFVSCGFCRPKETRQVKVRLNCRTKKGRPRKKIRKVTVVKKCRCMEQPLNLTFNNGVPV